MNTQTLLPKPMLAHDDSLVRALVSDFVALAETIPEPAAAPLEGFDLFLLVDELVDELTAAAEPLEISIELSLDDDASTATTVTDGVAEVA